MSTNREANNGAKTLYTTRLAEAVTMCRHSAQDEYGPTHERIITDYEFEINLRGNRIIVLNGEIHEVAKNSMTVRQPGQRVWSEGGFDCYLMNLDPKLMSCCAPEGLSIDNCYEAGVTAKLPLFFFPKHIKDYTEIFDRMIAAYQKQPRDNETLELCIRAMLNLCRFDALEAQLSQKNTTTSLMDEICAYITNNYGKCITLDELADMAHLNKNHFARTFKKEIGLSPINYLIEVRLQNAKDTLTVYDIPVKTVCKECGFNNPSYFNYAFKQHFGMTPGEYRMQLRSPQKAAPLPLPKTDEE